jgi:hypothetical protein
VAAELHYLIVMSYLGRSSPHGSLRHRAFNAIRGSEVVPKMLRLLLLGCVVELGGLPSAWAGERTGAGRAGDEACVRFGWDCSIGAYVAATGGTETDLLGRIAAIVGSVQNDPDRPQLFGLQNNATGRVTIGYSFVDRDTGMPTAPWVHATMAAYEPILGPRLATNDPPSSIMEWLFWQECAGSCADDAAALALVTSIYTGLLVAEGATVAVLTASAQAALLAAARSSGPMVGLTTAQTSAPALNRGLSVVLGTGPEAQSFASSFGATRALWQASVPQRLIQELTVRGHAQQLHHQSGVEVRFTAEASRYIAPFFRWIPGSPAPRP